MRQQIEPLKVIQQDEGAGDNAGAAIIHTIVAIDNDTDSCWNDRGEAFVLSEVEQWARPIPENEVWHQPIVIPNIAIETPDCTVAETLQSMQMKSMPRHDKFGAKPLESAAPIAAPVEQAKPAEQHKQIEVALSDADKVLATLVDKAKQTFAASGKSGQNYVSLNITCSKLELDKFLTGAEMLGYSLKEVLTILIKTDSIDSVHWQDA